MYLFQENFIANKPAGGLPPENKADIEHYYQEAGPDYREWSPHFNMHFGFYRTHVNPLNREAMLEQMNKEIFARLGLKDAPASRVLDFGCGMGATLRTGARSFAAHDWQGITIVENQARRARELNFAGGLGGRIGIVVDDFTNSKLPDNSFDFIYAVESICHAPTSDKKSSIRELLRLLKPGGRFVIADGFLINPEKPMGTLTKRLYKAMCEYWALAGMGQLEFVTEGLRQNGAEGLEVEDISWNVAPSVAHVPYVSIRFLLKSWLKGERLSRARLGNVLASVFTGFLGLRRDKFRYVMISGEKTTHREAQ